jgi:hypothetical protein
LCCSKTRNEQPVFDTIGFWDGERIVARRKDGWQYEPVVEES